MYSRRLKTEERKNRRRAYFLIGITLVLLLLAVTYGLSGAAKFSAFLLDLRSGSEPVEISDTTPPPPPRFNTQPTSTNQNKIDLSGGTEAGSIVIIDFKGKESEIVANSEGRFLFSLTLSEGSNRIVASAKDNSGNISQETTLEIILDKEPPPLEITKPEDGEEFFGSRQRQLIIEGKTEENAKVQINDRLVVVEGEGIFSFATTLSEGENSFTVKAEDEAGNSTEKTFKVSYAP